jgi:hypothetical protein
MAVLVQGFQKPPGVIVVGRIRVLPMVEVGIVLVVVVVGDVTVGIVGSTVADVTGSVGVIVGTAAGELTPRLPIS